MKTRINTKLLILTTMSILAMSGCTQTISVISDDKSVDVLESTPVKSTWGTQEGVIASQVVDDSCLNCQVSIPGVTTEKTPTYTYDYSNAPEDTLLASTPVIDSFSNKTSVQVGAFRKYAGAKVYAKKYDLLSNKYDVEIQKNVRGNRLLYCVRIEGFSNKSEAREFISKYAITEAFLVRK